MAGDDNSGGKGPAAEESTFMRAFHLIFGHGSAHHPGGSSRQEFAGWGLFLHPLIIPILGLMDAEGEPSGIPWWTPIVMLIGVLLIRSAKKMP